ncbi:lytic transglycosylase domain-containing protein [Pseudomonas sp. MWU12-2345]|uniref:lytic transglycosylase domain-containing protein n=1 Tax=Pseudomonas sp. MWU12-2345 TaxID=2928689 RepID=UPI00200F541A|nr:lytic transglycosylase domain-containing protein [Pseudomonas sp. MWU12-2345]
MPDFKIVISAVDKATATFRKVNDGVSRLTRPFEEVGKSFKSLGRELGFERIGKNLTTIGREAGGAARSVGMIVAPMAALTGVGSVAGIAALANNWANLGRSIDNSARGIGVSAGQLQSFQGAAKLVGIDAGTTTASLDSLATTMQDAQWGRNQGALLMLNKLGIGLKKTKDGAWDVVGEYKAIANAVASQKSPQVQALIANNLGLGGMLPFLREGAAGIEQYEDTVRRLGYVMSDGAVKQGKEFSKSLAGLNIAVDGTKNAIGDKLIPVMKPLVDQFTNWLAVNRDLIATNIADWAKGFATWINKVDWKAVGDGIINFGKGVGKVVDWLGGWQNAALLVVGVMNAGLIAGVLSLGITLVRAGAGIVAFTGLLLGWKSAATAAAAANDVATASAARSAGAGAIRGAGPGLLGKLGWVGMAGAAGYDAGTLINDNLIQGTEFQGWLGKQIAQVMAFGGSTEAKNALSINEGAKSGQQAGTQDPVAARQLFRQLELKNNLPPNLLDSVWNKESGRGANMLSGKGAKGHFGFMDPTATQYGLKDPSNLYQSADASARYFHDLLKANGGNLDRALAAYNWGQGNLDKKGMGAAPAETRDYISKIKAQMAGAQATDAQASAPQGPYTQGAQQASGGVVKVEIEHKNTPEGTKTKVKSVGNVQASSRIAYSGVGAIA